MNVKTYTTLPQEAKDIRIKVFMKEQGFENEFDDIDQISSHIVVAVLKEYRNQHIGNLLLKSAEKEIKKLNGDLIVVHAQVRVSPFYENQGYIQFGQIDDDEGVPHMWMKKKIQY